MAAGEIGNQRRMARRVLLMRQMAEPGQHQRFTLRQQGDLCGYAVALVPVKSRQLENRWRILCVNVLSAPLPYIIETYSFELEPIFKPGSSKNRE